MKFACPSCGRVYDEDIQAGVRVECACSQRFRPGSDRGRSIPGDFRIGEVVGRCMLLQVLGHGAMGTVYRGRHIALDLPVAVKILRSEFQIRPDYIQRFLREARTAGEISHPNIVRILDCGQKNSTLYLIMEYVPGGDVGKWLEFKTRLSVEDTLKIGRSISRGLMAVEQLGIIHRDIKPQNIMRASSGEYKLADLGMAKHVLGSGNDATITTAAVAMGTPHYMAPEQALDARRVDHRADLYSLGASLYHMLAGTPPFPRHDSRQVLDAHAELEPPPLCSVNTTVPVEVANIIHLCMAKRPQDRYQSAAELHHDLKLVLKSAGDTKTVQPLIVNERRNINQIRRLNLLGTTALAALTLLLVLVLGVFWLLRMPTVNNTTSANHEQLLQRVNQLRRQMRSPEAQEPPQRVRLLAALTATMCELGTADAAVETFELMIKALAAADPQQRQSLLATINTAATAFVQTPGSVRAKVGARLPYIRGLVGELYKPDAMQCDATYVGALAKQLDLHGSLENSTNYWLHLRYALKQWTELQDFHRGRRRLDGQDEPGEALQAWQVGNGRLQASPGGYSAPLLWRLPHQEMLSLSFEYVPLADDDFAADLVLAASPASGFMPLPDVGLRLHSSVTSTGSVEHSLFAGNELLTNKQEHTLNETGTIRIDVELVAPQLSIRVNGHALVAGGVPLAQIAPSHGYWGVQLRNGGALQKIRIALPVEDWSTAESSLRPHFYPLGMHGSRRFDRIASIEPIDPDLAAQVPAGLLDKLPQKLAAADHADGQFASFASPTSVALLRFPVLRESDTNPGELHLYCLGRSRLEDDTSSSGVLQLWNVTLQQWQEVVPLHTTYLSERQCYLLHVAQPFTQLSEYLDIYDEVLIRYTGGNNTSVEVDHALLVLML